MLILLNTFILSNGINLNIEKFSCLKFFVVKICSKNTLLVTKRARLLELFIGARKVEKRILHHLALTRMTSGKDFVFLFT